jgi:4-alpha-glucanotransferase
MERALRRLAASFGLQIGYYDISRTWRKPSHEAILEVLKSLGAELERIEESKMALRARQESLWSRSLEAGAVGYESKPVRFRVRLPKNAPKGPLLFNILEETGSTRRVTVPFEDLNPISVGQNPNAPPLYSTTLPIGLPIGYHTIRLELGEKEETVNFFCSPKKSFVQKDWRSLGLFLPMYAMHSKNSMGVGDFGDLERLASFAIRQGVNLVGMLPLTSSFVDGPLFNPSPYSPVSRLFLNPVFIDINRIPELKDCKEAVRRLKDPTFKASVQALNEEPFVDYRRAMHLKRQILEPLAEATFLGGNTTKIEAFIQKYPKVKEFALFMAAVESLGLGFRSWPKRMEPGSLSPGDVPPKAFRYHLYCQWQACRQLDTLNAQTKAKGLSLYLDLPVGVHPDGFDAWHYQDSYIEGLSIGSPPDTFFTLGQNWGFLPPHPQKTREAGHPSFIETMRRNLELTGVLRLDHVMGLHRLFVIPNGFEAKDGLYLHYPHQELYAILAIESHRAKSMLVGEDLGTVPGYVRLAMEHFGLNRIYVFLTEVRLDANPPLQEPIEDALACLETHDMPTFAAFIEELDIKERLKLSQLSPDLAQKESESRQFFVKTIRKALKEKGLLKEDEGIEAILWAVLRFLAQSQARITLVNLEDLWLERTPQNTPGTGDERPNWRKKAALSLEQLETDPKVLRVLRELVSLRKF